MIGGLAVLLLAGCGKRENRPEPLAEIEEAVAPVEEEVEPAVEEGPEGIGLHVYCGDENAEHIVQKTVYTDEVNPQEIMRQLVLALGIDEKAGLKEISFGMHNGDRVVILDLNQAFGDCVNQMGTSGEYIVMGSLTNTFLDCYQSDLLLVKVEGKALETGHSIYEEYLEMYEYMEASYRIRDEKLSRGRMQVLCPQIEGLGDPRIQEKWNQIIRKNEEQGLANWDESGSCEIGYQIKTMTADLLSILMEGSYLAEGTSDPVAFQYTYNIDLNTGNSIRLKDHVDVQRAAEKMFAGTGYYVDEALSGRFVESLQAVYGSPDALARSLEGYDYAEDGSLPYGYSYLSDGKVWICMEVPHSLGDYIEIELGVQEQPE